MATVLPPSQLKFSKFKNIVYDTAVYEVEIDGKLLPFYKFQIILRDDSKNTIGMIDVLYNYKYLVMKNFSFTKDQKQHSVEIGVVIPLDKVPKSELPSVLQRFITVANKGSVAKVIKSELKKVSVLNPNSYVPPQTGGIYESNDPNKLLNSSIWDKMAKVNLIASTLSNITNIILIAYPVIGIYAMFKKVKLMRKIKTEKEEVENMFRKIEFENLMKYNINYNHPSIRSFVRIVDTLLSGTGSVNGALVVGSPGVGKTFTLKKVLMEKGLVQDKDYGMIKAVPKELEDFISLLYKYREKKLVILDDADYALDSDLHRQILLQVLDSSSIRVVVTPPSKPVVKVEMDDAVFELDKFVVKSRYIIITNKKLEQIPSNIKSRCYIVNMHFTNEEIIDLIKVNLENIEPEIPVEIKKQILYDTYTILRAAGLDLSFRQFNVALVYYKMYGDMWKEQFKRALNIDK